MISFRRTAAISSLLLITASPFLQAANKTWNGGGADNLWSTGANWGGAAPVIGDHLAFGGSARQLNTNDLGGLAAGWVQFANDGFVLRGNPLTLNPSTPGLLTNSSGTNVIALDLSITPSGKVWNVAAGSELHLAGDVSHSAASNPLIILHGGGTLRISSANFIATRAMTLNGGTVIVDGAFVQHANDGIRFVPAAGETVTARLINNGTWRIGGGGNFRLAFSGTQPGSVSQMLLESGTLEFYGNNASGGNIYVGEVSGAAAAFRQDGGLVTVNSGGGNALILGAVSGANGTYHLNGGVLRIGQVRQGNSGAATAIFNFNGGTLAPFGDSATFFDGVQAARVLDGGAIIDAAGFNITIGQNLQAAGNGGLVKLGSGTLTLGGACDHAGGTVVSNGTLLLTGSLTGPGGVTVKSGALGGSGTAAGPAAVLAGAALSPGTGAAPGTLTLQGGLVLNGNLLVDVNKSAAPTNDLVEVSGTVTNGGTGTVFLLNHGSAYEAGDRFKLVSQPMLNGQALTISPAIPGPGLVWSNRLAQDGTVEVVGLPGGNPANLSGLLVSAGSLDPAFSSNVLTYTVSIAYSNAAISLAPTAATPGATIRIVSDHGTNTVNSGAASAPVPLRAGTNRITIEVTAPAPDDLATREYVVSVYRIPPNVLLVLADDGGFSDWGCYGGEIPTPNLDRLATNGLRFRQFYNTARCSTTRCSLLTGLYTHQVAVDPAQALPNLRTDNNVTIAELLGANGYRTYLSGKWHLGTAAGLNPWQRGFQHYWGFPNGHSADNWRTNEYRLVSFGNEVPGRIYAPGTFHQTESIGDYSLDFLAHHFSKHDQKPFFLHMTFGAGHFPLQAPKAMVDAHVARYAAGWDAVRAARYQRMLDDGVIDARYLLSPRSGTAPHQSEPIEEIPAWNTLGADRQADLARRMAIYAAMVEQLDANVGRVVERLRQQGELENTLIIALSDNGGNHEGGRFGQTGGVANAAPLTGTALANMGLDGQPIIYLGGGWANVNNTPFRLFKHSTHGGGVRTPLIIHWPQGITRTNEWDDQPGHLIDIMATLVDVTGVAYPTQYLTRTVLPLEGISLKPKFSGNAQTAREIGFEHESNRALISDNWKFVTKNFALYDGSSWAHELELYDLETDPVELTNLAYAQPERLSLLASNWNRWAQRVGVPSGRWLASFTNPPPPLLTTPAPGTNDLFLDTFSRANQTDADLTAGGMSGSRVPPIGAGAAYFEGYEGSGASSSIQVLNGTLQMAVGAGMSENGLRHNFVGPDIAVAGGFSVEINIHSISTDSSDAANRYAGFGVGLSAEEAATGWDIGNALGAGAVAFRGSLNGNTGVADFFVELDFNGNVKVWRNGTLADSVPVGKNFGVLTAAFACGGFSTSDTVTVNVFFNGEPVDINTADGQSISRTFQWDRNDSNYIGLSARASGQVQLDNLAIRKLPVAGGLAMHYAMQHGLSELAAGPGADPDGDGVVNFGEWAFGGNPVSEDLFLSSLNGARVTAAGHFRFQFQRRAASAGYGLRYRYFVSSDLQAWEETTPTQVGTTVDGNPPGYEWVTLELPLALTAGRDALFVRVLAEAMG